MSITWTVEVDFDDEGSFETPGDDLSAYVRRCEVGLGIRGGAALTAGVGACRVILDNADRRFSPENAAGPYFGRLRPNLPVQVRITHEGETWTLFRGFTSGWEPDSGEHGARSCTLICADLLERLRRTPIAMPLREDERGDQLVQHLLNYAFDAPAATGAVSFAALPAGGDTVSIEGVIYTFQTTLNLSIPNQVRIGATIEETADNLAAAISGGPGQGSAYTAGTTRPATCTASVRPGYYRAVTGDGAIRYYRFGESSGTAAKDSGINGRDATYYNGVALGLGGALANDPDTAASFDGTNDYVEAPILDLAYRSFTVECWIRPDADMPTFMEIGGFHTAPSPRRAIILRVYNDGKVLFAFFGDPLLQTAAGAVTLGAWNHVAFTYDVVADRSRIYVNGTLRQQGSVGPFEGASPRFHVGVALTSIDKFFKGRIDEYAVYLRALSGEQVAAHYAARDVAPGVEIRATLPGAVGNAIALAKTGSAITLSGPTLSGGADYPLAPLPELEAGSQVFDLAGDGWRKDATDALEALRQVTASERGLAWVARDGAFTWRNAYYLFRQVAAEAALTLAGELRAEGSLGDARIANAIILSTTPPSVAEAGVVARANRVIVVPGQSGTARYDPNAPLVNPGGGSTIIALPFVDPETGQPAGARDLILPLEAGIDWAANERRDGSGIDYTGSPSLSFSVAVTATEAQVSIRNTALGPLYLTLLQIRGRLITRYDPIQIVREDAASRAAYGMRALPVELPLPVGQTFAESVAAYLLSRHRSPAFVVERLEARGPAVGGHSLLALEIGDVIALGEAQMGIAGAKYLVTGLRYRLSPGVLESLILDVRRLDDVTYGIFDDATYGRFDETLRFAI